jgi:hypothetical protein
VVRCTLNDTFQLVWCFFFTRLSLDAICHTVDLWLLDCHQRSSTQTVLLSYPI